MYTFLVNYISFIYFFNRKFKPLFSWLHQNILGQNGDVRYLCSPADHLVFSDSVAIPAGSPAHQTLLGENHRQRALNQFHPEEKEAASLDTRLGEDELGYYSVQDRRH